MAETPTDIDPAFYAKARALFEVELAKKKEINRQLELTNAACVAFTNAINTFFDQFMAGLNQVLHPTHEQFITEHEKLMSLLEKSKTLTVEDLNTGKN